MGDAGRHDAFEISKDHFGRFGLFGGMGCQLARDGAGDQGGADRFVAQGRMIGMGPVCRNFGPVAQIIVVHDVLLSGQTGLLAVTSQGGWGRGNWSPRACFCRMSTDVALREIVFYRSFTIC